MRHHVDAGEIEQRLYDEGRPVVSSVESLIGQQPRDGILDDVPDFAEPGAVSLSTPPDERFYPMLTTEIAVGPAVVAGISKEICNRYTDSLGKFHQIWQHYGVIDVGFRGNRAQGRAVRQGDDMIFCSRLATIRGIWTNEISTVLRSDAATVDHDPNRFGRGHGTGTQSPNEIAMDLAQRSVREPPSEPSAQGGAADASVGRGESPPSDPFVDKVTEGLKDLPGLRPRMTRVNFFGIDLVNHDRDDVYGRRSYGLSPN